MSKLFAVVLSIVLLAGCSSLTTPYQKTGIAGGFSETQLAENQFRVTFEANAFTSANRAIDFTLLRSAELTIKHGYTYFRIIDSQNTTKKVSIYQPVEARTSGSRTTFTGGGVTNLYKPGISNTIVLYKTKPDGVNVYKARFIIQSIRQKYGL